MTGSFRRSTSAIVVACVLILSCACMCTERQSSQPSALVPSATAGTRHPLIDNPFTRTSAGERSECCFTMTLQAGAGSSQIEASVANACNHAVALLTTPLDIRTRRTGTEPFVNERMPWAAYAVLYVAPVELGPDAFWGDGVIRDGGLRLHRPPGYTPQDHNHPGVRDGKPRLLPVRTGGDQPVRRHGEAEVHRAREGPARYHQDHR